MTSVHFEKSRDADHSHTVIIRTVHTENVLRNLALIQTLELRVV